MDAILFSPEDRMILMDLTAELRRFNNNAEKTCSDELLSCRETAQYLGVTPQTVSTMIRQHRLDKVVRGGREGILKSQVTRIKRASK